MRRSKLVQEIYQAGELIKTNKSTLVFLLAMMNDKALTKFHKEFLENTQEKLGNTK